MKNKVIAVLFGIAFAVFPISATLGATAWVVGEGVFKRKNSKKAVDALLSKMRSGEFTVFDAAKTSLFDDLTENDLKKLIGSSASLGDPEITTALMRRLQERKNSEKNE